MQRTSLGRVYVWEIPVRFYHWLNALCILVLCITMALVAWLVGREYARRYGVPGGSGSGGALAGGGARTVLAQ